MSAIEPKSETLVALTAEQDAFVADCNAAFEDRYTEIDAEFMVVKNFASNTQPLVDPWYNKPRRNFEWDRGDRGDGSGDNHRSIGERLENKGGGYRQHRQNQGNYHPRNYASGDGHHPQRQGQGDRLNQRNRPY